MGGIDHVLKYARCFGGQSISPGSACAVERLSRRAEINLTWESAKLIAEGTRLLDCRNQQFYAAAFTRLLLDERLTTAAADVIGSPNV